ncbi:MAG: hypothetical protein ISS36_00150 [Candidatus Aenigmarchaeota archaeon]|nr:hypothetical protein [Candidatus Aenigmarchaeota archaeon]
MEKKEIVMRFVEKGVLLSPEVLKNINEENIEFYLKKADNQEQTILGNIEKESKVNVKIKRVVVKEKLLLKNFIKYYNNRYNGLKKILLEKVNPVSINNIKNSFSIVAVIGMVKEMRESGFILEDMTGSVEVISKNKVDIDDVIAVKGMRREEKLLENKIIFPNIPKENRLRKIDGVKVAFMKKLNKELKADFIFTEEGKEEKNVFTNFTNPSWITISRGNNEMNILVYKPEKDVNPNIVVDYLVKRHLKPEPQMIKSEEDYFLLEPIPDIMWILSEKKWARNYNGVSIISCGGGGVLVDLGKRGVEFI